MSQPPIHPGQYLLSRYIEPLAIKQVELAEALHIDQSRLSEFIHQKRPCSIELAFALSFVIGEEPLDWLDMQTLYDAETFAAENPNFDKKFQRII